MELVEEIKRIEGRLSLATPHELAEHKLMLSSIYSRFSELMMEVLRRKALAWGELRKTTKSDTSTDRLWDATSDGLQEMELKQWLKVIEKMISSINTMLRISEAEAKNTF